MEFNDPMAAARQDPVEAVNSETEGALAEVRHLPVNRQPQPDPEPDRTELDSGQTDQAQEPGTELAETTPTEVAAVEPSVSGTWQQVKDHGQWRQRPPAVRDVVTRIQRDRDKPHLVPALAKVHEIVAWLGAVRHAWCQFDAWAHRRPARFVVALVLLDAPRVYAFGWIVLQLHG